MQLYNLGRQGRYTSMLQPILTMADDVIYFVDAVIIGLFKLEMKVGIGKKNTWRQNTKRAKQTEAENKNVVVE